MDQETILSWLRAGCPVPLNWWDDETAAKRPPLKEPAPVDQLLEFGGSMAGMHFLSAYGGEEGQRAIEAIHARQVELNLRSDEACKRLKSVGLEPVNVSGIRVSFRLELPRDEAVFHRVDEVLSSVGLKSRYKSCYSTVPIADYVGGVRDNEQKCMEVGIDLDDPGLILDK